MGENKIEKMERAWSKKMKERAQRRGKKKRGGRIRTSYGR